MTGNMEVLILDLLRKEELYKMCERVECVCEGTGTEDYIKAKSSKKQGRDLTNIGGN